MVQQGEEETWELNELHTRLLQARRKMVKQHTKLLDQMKGEQIEVFKAKCKSRFTTPGAKEIARFLGKRAGRLDLWGLLPRSKERWYPSELKVKGDSWRASVLDVCDETMGKDLDMACMHSAGEWVTLLDVKRGDRIRL